MNITHELEEYKRMCRTWHTRCNGAYYYSKEICRNIMPKVKTDRHWVTIKAGERCIDHSLVFIHNNLNPQRYKFLHYYKDLVLVCGVPGTCGKVASFGKAIYLPLSVDVEEVKKHRQPKTRELAFAGRKAKMTGFSFPEGTDFLYGMNRERLLDEMAKYKKVFAVGRTAIEAKILGCEVLPYDPRFPDPDVWKIIDNREAAAMLQTILDKIDGKGRQDDQKGAGS